MTELNDSDEIMSQLKSDKWKGIASSEKSRENLTFFSCLNLGQIWGKRLPFSFARANEKSKFAEDLLVCRKICRIASLHKSGHKKCIIKMRSLILI